MSHKSFLKRALYEINTFLICMLIGTIIMGIAFGVMSIPNLLDYWFHHGNY